MNTYTFGSSELRLSDFRTVYSMCAISFLIVVSQLTLVSAGREHARLVKDAPGVSTEKASSVTKATLGPELTPVNNVVQEKLNCTLDVNVNKTECSNSEDDRSDSFLQKMTDNKDMLLRTLYVILGVTGIVLVYFITRALWLRRNRTKSRKYRIIAQSGDQKDIEMEPLGDGNDDDEDYTVFELNGRKK